MSNHYHRNTILGLCITKETMRWLDQVATKRGTTPESYAEDLLNAAHDFAVTTHLNPPLFPSLHATPTTHHE